MKRFIIFIVVFIVGLEPIKSQDIDDFVIVTFEIKRNIERHKKAVYYWIVNSDSTINKGFSLKPLYFSGYSKTHLDKCCNGDTINPYIITKHTSFDFAPNYESDVKVLKELIEEKKIKVQTIKKKRGNEYTETVNVYATPVKGEFCKCYLKSFGFIDYEGEVYLPLKNLKDNSAYWELTWSKNIKFSDYSFFFYVNNSEGHSIKNIPKW